MTIARNCFLLAGFPSIIFSSQSLPPNPLYHLKVTIMTASTHHTGSKSQAESVPTFTEAISALFSKKDRSSSSSSSSAQSNYAPSVNSASTASTYSIEKPSKKQDNERKRDS